jgi:beta-ribofuranosylaminobenzene 5'-phosphate synthase
MSDATLRIRTPSRIHFGLIDMNGEVGRIEGGLGVALDEPGVELCARRAGKVSIGGRVALPDRTREQLESLCACFRQKYPVAGVDLEIERVIPGHSGLGSGTQLAMAVGLAFSVLYDLNLTSTQLAILALRGGTGGIGYLAFDKGGFVGDGGHRFGGPGGKTAFAPTAASVAFPPPPILFHSPLPSHWRVVLALPVGRIVHGEEERALFAQNCPVPSEEAAQSARLALMKILPAVIEADLEAFGAGIEAMQRLGFKRYEIARQVETVHDTMAEMRRLGLRGVGMSSWGPALFGFTDAGPERDRATAQALESFGARRGGITLFVTKASERGATWKWE